MHKPLIALFLLLGSVAPAQPPASPAIADPAPDPAHPARMEVVLVPSGGVRVNGVMYVASGRGPKPTAVLFHGFPGNEKNLDLAQAVRRAGWTVLTLNYRGSWGSPGRFSYANAIEDGKAAVAFLRNPVNAAKYGIDPKRIAVIGHSMGAMVAAKTAAADPAIVGTVLLDAWNPAASRNADPKRRGEAIAGIAEDLPPLAGTSAEALVDEVAANAVRWDTRLDARRLADRPLLLIAALRDGLRDSTRGIADAARASGGRSVDYREYQTDHSFSDHRVTLATAVAAWLGRLSR